MKINMIENRIRLLPGLNMMPNYFILKYCLISCLVYLKEIVAFFHSGAKSPEDFEFPVCVNNLLDKRECLYEISNGMFCNTVRTDSAKPHGLHLCRLLKYSTELAVACIDTLYQKYVNARNQPDDANRTIIQTELHFVFMGDSRIRQQFFNFLQLIPDYDRQTYPTYIQRNVNAFNHGDVDWCSSMLRLRVSYKWRPLINDTVIEMFRQWTEQTQKPYLIFLSMETHHMLVKNGNDYHLFRKKLIEFGKTLGQLAESSDLAQSIPNRGILWTYAGTQHRHSLREGPPIQ